MLGTLKKSRLIGFTRLVQIIAIIRNSLSDETEGLSEYAVPVGGIRQHATVSEGQPRAVDACAFAVASRLGNTFDS